MSMFKYITCGFLSLALAGAFGTDAMAQEKKKKKKKKKKAEPAGETTDTAGAEGAAAAATEGGDSGYKAAYGAAGCGLGSIVIGSKPGMMQLFAATLNATGYQTLAITTGTSNCKDGPSGEAAAMERKVYVDMNLADLSKEAAQGDGEHLEAFADILGCAESEEDLAAFQMLSQQKYAVLFNNQASDAVVEGFVNEIKADETLSANCVRAY